MRRTELSTPREAEEELDLCWELRHRERDLQSECLRTRSESGARAGALWLRPSLRAPLRDLGTTTPRKGFIKLHDGRPEVVTNVLSLGAALSQSLPRRHAISHSSHRLQKHTLMSFL